MAKKYRKKAGPGTRESGKKATFTLILLAFVFGYLSSQLIDKQATNQWFKAHWFAWNKKTEPPKPELAVKPALPKPKFEFYTLLTEGHQEVAPVKEKVTPIKTVSPGTWLVQLASFKRKEEAEKMRADLILKGFQVQVSVAEKENLTWYRVVAGPFSSRDKAAQMRDVLAHREQLAGMLRKVDV